MNEGKLQGNYFQTPEQEIAFLKEQITKKEQELIKKKEEVIPAQLIKQEVQRYSNQPIDQTLEKGHRMLHNEVENTAFGIDSHAPERMLNEVVAVFEERGLRNALEVVEKLNNPHVEDDFHRFLVKYFHGVTNTGAKIEKSYERALDRTLFEVLLPSSTPSAKTTTAGEVREKPLKELLAGMEQFFAGMLSVADKRDKDNYFSFELANTHSSLETVFYISVPSYKAHLLEKQLLAIYPEAKINETPNDYNIFNPDGVSVASYASSARNPIFPIKTYEQFDHDPASIILNTFSKIQKDGEGAALQFVIQPAGDKYNKHYTDALKQIEKGVPFKHAIDIKDTLFGSFTKDLKEMIFHSDEKKKDDDKKDLGRGDQEKVDQIKLKIASQIVLTNIRIVASAESRPRAEHILSDIESAFNQFENTSGNTFKFNRVEKNKLKALEKDFIFRNFSFGDRIPLSLRELATTAHFAARAQAPQLRTTKTGSAPAPLALANDGVTLGINSYRGVETTIKMTREDRMRHFYTIGQTGTGKSTLIKNMAIQDVQNGDGICFIDPHGIDIQDILAAVPKERINDVIYFDPSYTPRPMALNMLEYDRDHPEQKTFVVNEMLSIFEKLFDMKVAGGPMFEQYFRNATMLVIEDPDTGNTLLEVSRVLADKKFRELKLSRCRNPIVVQFWKEVAEKAGGEASLANMVPYITSKFDVFLSNDIMRPIIGQEKSSFNFRDVMDNKKILLVNLAKGRLGDINSYLIGLILVGKILMAALSRVDVVGKPIADFYLYIDEFQNVTTPSIATILSEARKYRLSLNLAHQFIAQLDEKTRDAVFGNVGSFAAFRVGATDAEFLEKQFEPVFTASDLMNIDNRNAYLKLLINGQPAKPFNIQTLPPTKSDPAFLEKLKELSYLTYGSPREGIEAEIHKKYRKPEQTLNT